MTDLGSAFGRITLDFSGVVTGAQGAAGQLTSFGKSVEGLGSQLSTLSVPIAAVGAAAFKLSSDFGASMQKIVGLAGVAQKQVDAWSQDLLAMAPQVGRGPKELADALYFVSSAGIKGQAALDLVRDSAKAAAAGLGETKTIADAASSAMNAYASTGLTSSQAIGVLTAAVRNGKVEASSLAPVLGSVIPIAAEMGITFDQVGAAIAAQTRVGFDAASAATNLTGVMNAFLKPGKQAADVMKEYGLTADGLKQTIKEHGLLAALTLLKDTVGQNDDAVVKIFPNIRGFRGMLSLVGQDAQTTAGIFKDVANTMDTSLDTAFNAVAEDSKFKFEQAMASAQASLVKIGDAVSKAVIPVIQDLSQFLNKLADGFAALPASTQQTIVSIAGLVAVAGPLLMIGGKLIGVVGSLFNTFMSVGGTVVKAAQGIGEFVQVLGLAEGPMEALKFIMSTTAIQIGILVAGLVIVAKFIEQVGVAANATTDDLEKMAHSGDMFEQAAATTEILAHGQDRLSAAFVSTEAKIRASATSYKDYESATLATAKASGDLGDEITGQRANMFLADEAAGHLAAGFTILDGKVYSITSSFKLLTQAEFEASQGAYGVGGALDESTRATANSAQRDLDKKNSLDGVVAATDPAIDAAKALADSQAAEAAANIAAGVELDNLKTLMAGAVGKELTSYSTKNKDLTQQAADLKKQIDDLNAAQGTAVTTGKKAGATADEQKLYTLQLSSAQAQYNATLDPALPQRLATAESALSHARDPKKVHELTAEVNGLKAASDPTRQAQLAVTMDNLNDKLGKGTTAVQGYVDNSKKIGELSAKYDDVNKAIADNAQAHDDATKRILFDMLQQQLSVNGFTVAEATALEGIATKWGLVDSATAQAQLKVTDAVAAFEATGDADALMGALNGTLQTVNTTAYGTQGAAMAAASGLNSNLTPAAQEADGYLHGLAGHAHDAATAAADLNKPVTVKIKADTGDADAKLTAAEKHALKLEEPVVTPVKVAGDFGLTPEQQAARANVAKPIVVPVQLGGAPGSTPEQQAAAKPVTVPVDADTKPFEKGVAGAVAQTGTTLANAKQKATTDGSALIGNLKTTAAQATPALQPLNDALTTAQTDTQTTFTAITTAVQTALQQIAGVVASQSPTIFAPFIAALDAVSAAVSGAVQGWLGGLNAFMMALSAAKAAAAAGPGGSAPAASPAGSSTTNPNARALGGPITIGQSYLINESPATRPEIIVPSTSGYVLTRQDAQAALVRALQQGSGQGNQRSTVIQHNETITLHDNMSTRFWAERQRQDRLQSTLGAM